MIDQQLPGQNKPWTVGFVAGDGAQAKVLIDVTPAQILTVLAGETAVPGETGVRQQILRGGCRAINGSIGSTDAAPKSMLLYRGAVATLFASMGAPTITTQNVINRTAGSFLVDADNNGRRWRVGDLVFPFEVLTATNNGAIGVVSAVAALTLTVNGTPWTNENLPAGSRLIRAALKTRRAVPANAGNTDAIPPVVLMGGVQDPDNASLPDTQWNFGPNDVLLCAMVAAVAALPAVITVNADSVLF